MFPRHKADYFINISGYLGTADDGEDIISHKVVLLYHKALPEILFLIIFQLLMKEKIKLVICYTSSKI